LPLIGGKEIRPALIGGKKTSCLRIGRKVDGLLSVPPISLTEYK
jgi:hypothetical protein